MTAPSSISGSVTVTLTTTQAENLVTDLADLEPGKFLVIASWPIIAGVPLVDPTSGYAPAGPTFLPVGDTVYDISGSFSSPDPWDVIFDGTFIDYNGGAEPICYGSYEAYIVEYDWDGNFYFSPLPVLLAVRRLA